jgi:hypothetical protein
VLFYIILKIILKLSKKIVWEQSSTISTVEVQYKKNKQIEDHESESMSDFKWNIPYISLLFMIIKQKLISECEELWFILMQRN